MDLNVIAKNFDFMLGGLTLTFQLAVMTIAGGLFIGIILAMARLSSRSWLYYPATLYIHFFSRPAPDFGDFLAILSVARYYKKIHGSISRCYYFFYCI